MANPAHTPQSRAPNSRSPQAGGVAELIHAGLAHHQAGRLSDALAAYTRVLGSDPRQFDALYLGGTAKLQLGDIKGGVKLLRRAVKVNGRHPSAQNNLGSGYQGLGQHREAVPHFRKAIAAKPDYAEAHANLGKSLIQLNKQKDAEAALTRAIELQPANTKALELLGTLMQNAGRFESAVDCYARSLALNANQALVQAMQGACFLELDELDKARVAFEAALRIDSSMVRALHGLAATARRQRKLDEAERLVEKALAKAPDDAEIHLTKGHIFRDKRNYAKAFAGYQAAAEANPKMPAAHAGISWASRWLGDLKTAEKHARHAIDLDPDYPDAYSCLGDVFTARDDTDSAIVAYGTAINRGLKSARLYYLFAECVMLKKRFPEGIHSMIEAVKLEPDYYAAYRKAYHAARHICDFPMIEKFENTYRFDVAARKRFPVPPFSVLSETDDPASHKAHGEWFSQRYVRTIADFATEEAKPLPALPAPPAPGEKIVLGYYSNDYHEHATAYLMAELFELHDRSRFEVRAYCYTPDVKTEMRDRLMAGVDAFVKVKHLNDLEVAEQVRADGVHIFIDLKGWTSGSRSGGLGLRPGPIQVSWLGYPGTLGTEAADYIIGDPWVTPEGSEEFFTEKVVRLPDTYQMNDRKRKVAVERPTRADWDLPEDRFVFASLNQSYKISPEIFERWMEIMTRVPDSVLWLLDSNDWAPDNLREAAEARGVSGERLIFSGGVPAAQHLARYPLADLCIDTFPYTSHTTASDALWMGVPLVTLAGQSFPARVAASLLASAGVPELIAQTPEAFVELAVSLANDGDTLQALRDKLEANRMSCPLFDSARFTRHMEAAYEEMVATWRAGEEPKAIDVVPVQG